MLLPLWIDALPPKIARAVGVTGAPPGLRALFGQTPAEVEVEVVLPVGAELPVAARQLIKLMATRPQWIPSVDRGTGLMIRCRRGPVIIELSGERFAAGLQEVVRLLFVGLFGASVLFGLGERFAGSVACLEVLQGLTQHMLASTDVDRALQILLSGLTACDGLGFSRAAVFVYDEIRQRFVGSRAIGPTGEAEVVRCSDETVIEGRSFAHIIAQISRREEASGLQARIVGVPVLPVESESDEVRAALASAGPLLFPGPASNPGLAGLGASGPFVLAGIKPRGVPLALIYVDNAFCDRELGADRVEVLSVFLAQAALVIDNLRLLRDVERLARYDSLTGVLSRREFEARMAIEETRCLRANHPCSLLIVDLDNFKAINDSKGHAAGDEVLKKTGGLLRQTLRAHDLVGRFGGDEFIVLLPETKGADLEKVIRRIGQLAWEQEIALSIGGASFPTDCEVPSALFSIADRNLLAAKRAGRRRACIGDDRCLRLPGGEPDVS